MHNYHPALVKVLQQDRYYRLVNEFRRGHTSDRSASPTSPAKKAR